MSPVPRRLRKDKAKEAVDKSMFMAILQVENGDQHTCNIEFYPTPLTELQKALGLDLSDPLDIPGLWIWFEANAKEGDQVLIKYITDSEFIDGYMPRIRRHGCVFAKAEIAADWPHSPSQSQSQSK